MTIQSNIPRLRFPEFKEEWKNKPLGNYIDLFKGKGLSKNDIIVDGKNKCIRYGELYTKYSEVIGAIYSLTNNSIESSVVSEANDVIIPASGETQIDIATASCVISSNIILGGDLNIIKTINNGVFLSYYLNSKKKIEIARLSQGVSVVHLYAKQLATLNLNFPTLPEQQKIATFLTAVDKKLTQLQNKKALLQDYKKGLMQQVFSQDLRFRPDDGSDFPDWEEKTLGEVLSYLQPTKYIVSSTEYDDSNKTPVLTAGKTFILGYTDESNNIFKEMLPVIIFDDFTTATQFVDFPFKVKSSAMKILVPREAENIKFIYEVMQMIEFITGGHGRHWISKYSVMNLEFPCLEEQTKIANFLSTIDKKTQLVSTQLEHTQAFKKGLLQGMFV